MQDKIAQVEIPVGNLSGIGDIGKAGANSVELLAKIISSLIGLMTIIGALYFMFVLITGSIEIISSGGDKASFENARRKLYTGVIGLVVVIAAMFIMDLITDLLGINNILDLKQMIKKIRIP